MSVKAILCKIFRVPTKHLDQSRAPPIGSPDRTLLQLGEHDVLSFRDGCHTHLMGQSGCGKTTSAGTAIAMAHLGNGHGGLVLAAKDDLSRWQAMCRWAGRESDLIVVDDGAIHSFNFLQYFASKSRTNAAMDAADVLNIACELASPGGTAKAVDPFWPLARGRLTRCAIDLLLFADVELSVDAILKVVVSAPTSAEQAEDSHWMRSSFCAQCCQAAAQKATEQDLPSVIRVMEYFHVEFAQLAANTRTSIVQTLTVAVDLLLRPPLLEMFSENSTVTPSDVLAGKVIYINLPTLVNGIAGSMAMGIWKISFQRALLRQYGDRKAPVFLFADEAQEHVNQEDARFLAVARELGCYAVFLTQNRAGYEARLGREGAEALLSSFQTHVFMANNGPTNQWASELLSKDWIAQTSYSHKASEDQQSKSMLSPSSVNTQTSKAFVDQVPPIEFTRMRTASPSHGGIADAIVFNAGKVWSSGLNYIRTSFQRIDF